MYGRRSWGWGGGEKVDVTMNRNTGPACLPGLVTVTYTEFLLYLQKLFRGNKAGNGTFNYEVIIFNSLLLLRMHINLITGLKTLWGENQVLYFHNLVLIRQLLTNYTIDL